MDPEEQLKSCIILGFTRGGAHLLSYTSAPTAAADGHEGCALQLWAFELGAPCRKLWSVPLFRGSSSLEGSGGGEEDFAEAPLAVTVAEAPGGQLLGECGRWRALRP